MIKILPVLVLCGTLLLGSPKQAHSDLHMGLFPEQPFYRTVMVDPDIPKTEIVVPQGLEKEILEKPIRELLPYISLSKTLPIISLNMSNKRLLSLMPKTTVDENVRLSDKIISASLLAGGQLNFPQNQENDIDYKTKFELFLNSPMIDTCLSGGNRLYLVGGFTGKGSAKLDDLANKNLSSIFKSLKIESHSFFADAYIVPKSPYSDQFLILRVGIDNIAGNISEKSNINISTTWEFPSLLHWLKIFENFKLSPYASMYFQIPTDSEKPTTASGQAGIKVSGESKRALFLYSQANYNEQKSWTFYTGLKLDF